MGFYADFWKNFVNFSGKTGLKDYWLTFLVNIVISAILGKINPNIAYIFSLAILIPFLAISARRLRDAGLHVLLVLTVIILPILLILCVFPSKR
ncbi:MAG: DUF805 domain-containing protein [Victivallales bacterium]|nr:DUF805 domain-containing protein [Victivallales bacterium]